jgi:hypothetical protein
MSITPIFYDVHLRQHSCTKKVQKIFAQNFRTKEESVKMLVKLTTCFSEKNVL